MKKIFLLFIMISSFSFAVAQDIVRLKNGNEMKVLVTELTSRAIRYKMADLQDGPVISMPKSSAESVTFRNGVTDMLGNQNPRKLRPLGVSGAFSIDLSGADYGFFGATLDYFLIPQVKLEITAGDDMESDILISGGPKFYFNSSASTSRFAAFAGIMAGTWGGYEFIQIPVGLDFQAKKGINCSISLNYLSFNQEQDVVSVEARVGYRFKL